MPASSSSNMGSSNSSHRACLAANVVTRLRQQQQQRYIRIGIGADLLMKLLLLLVVELGVAGLLTVKTALKI
jgi:hypothetical protein